MADEPTREELEAQVASLRTQLEGLAKAVVRAHHDVSNPLAIIAGNAQLLKEIGADYGLPDDLAACVSDIEAASEKLANALRALAEIRERIRWMSF